MGCDVAHKIAWVHNRVICRALVQTGVNLWISYLLLNSCNVLLVEDTISDEHSTIIVMYVNIGPTNEFLSN